MVSKWALVICRGFRQRIQLHKEILAKIELVFNCVTFVVCRRPCDKAGLSRNQGTRHIDNYSGNGGLIHTEGVAYKVKEISTSVEPEGN